jgi:ribosomal protein S18 acetylase RimI-like enzyme
VYTRIQSYLRVVAPIGRDVVQVGPFLATFHLKSSNPYLNYAIPEDAAEPTQSEVADLVGAYRERRRRARLEYVGQVAPRVEPALLAGGFAYEGRLPLMAFGGSEVVKVRPPEGIDLVVPTSDHDLYAMAAVQAEAYGEELPDPGIAADRRRALDDGSLAMVARDRQAKIVAAGSCSPIYDGLSEVAGIGVIRAQRRRGIATALAQRLAFELMTRGADLPWLMAAGDSEQQAYERAGFVVIGEILHLSVPHHSSDRRVSVPAAESADGGDV